MIQDSDWYCYRHLPGGKRRALAAPDMPERFTDAGLWRWQRKKEHPVYATSNNEYGKAQGGLSAAASEMSPWKGCSCLISYTWEFSAMWLKPYLLQAVRHHPSLRCPSLTAASKVASPSTTSGAPQRLETSALRLKPQESITNSGKHITTTDLSCLKQPKSSGALNQAFRT